MTRKKTTTSARCEACGEIFTQLPNLLGGRPFRNCEKHRGRRAAKRKTCFCGKVFIGRENRVNCHEHTRAHGKIPTPKTLTRKGTKSICKTCAHPYVVERGRQTYCHPDHNPYYLEQADRAELVKQYGCKERWPLRFREEKGT